MIMVYVINQSIQNNSLKLNFIQRNIRYRNIPSEKNHFVERFFLYAVFKSLDIVNSS